MLSALVPVPLPVYTRGKGTWKTFVNELSNWAFSRSIEYTLDRNDAARLNYCLTTGINPDQIARGQKTLFIALHHAFKDSMPSYVNYPDKSNMFWASNMWSEIYSKVKPEDAISAQDLIIQLSQATIFKGEVDEYIKRIRGLMDKLRSMGHPQSELLLVANIQASILEFAAKASDPHDKQWGDFCSSLVMNAPHQTVTLDLIEQYGTIRQRTIDSLRQRQHNTGIPYALHASLYCSYCDSPSHSFANCEKYRYDKKRQHEARGRSQERQFDHHKRSTSRSRSQGRSQSHQGDKSHSHSRSRDKSKRHSKSPYRGNSRSPGRHSSQTRFSPHTRFNSKSPRRDSSGKGGCFKCGSPNHWAKNCTFSGGPSSGNHHKRDRSRSHSNDRDRGRDKRRSYIADASITTDPQAVSQQQHDAHPGDRSQSPHPFPRSSTTSLLALDAWSRQQSFNPVSMMAHHQFSGQSHPQIVAPVTGPLQQTAESTTLTVRPLISPNNPVIKPTTWLSNIDLNVKDHHFPQGPGLHAYSATGASRGQSSPFTSRNNFDQFFIVDSGSNRHITCDERFIHRGEIIRHSIQGLGSQITATAQGPLIAQVFDKNGQPQDIISWALYIPDSRVSLFSVVQALLAGNQVVHEGDPATGRHGLYIPSTRAFIPFIWDPEAGLFWIRLRAIQHRPAAMIAADGASILRQD